MLGRRMAGFQGAVYLVVRPSLRLRRAACAVHVLAVVVIAWAYPLSVPALLLLAALAGNAWRIDRRLAHPACDDIAELVFSASGEWRIRSVDERVQGARLACPALVTAGLIALSLRGDDGRLRHVMLLADNVDADARRRLHVRLRHPRSHQPQ